MTFKRILSFICIILGIALFVLSFIISSKVDEGEQKIRKAQKGVHTVCSLTKVNPYANQIGKIATKSAKQKIKEGKQTAHSYKALSIWFRYGGIGLFVIGVVFLFFGSRKKS